MRLLRSKTRWLRVALVAAAWALAWRATAAEPELAETWEVSPYRIRVTLAIDAPGELGQQFAKELPTFLSDRANTSIGSLWRLTSEVAKAPLRREMLRNIDAVTADDLAAGAGREDKCVLVTLSSTPQGFELAAREYDRYVERWSPTIRRATRQLDAVGEQLFNLIVQAVSPLAHVRPDPQDPSQVLLEMRGADLPTSAVDFTAIRPGDVLLPLLRRTTREGALVPGSISAVPWTYLEVVAPPAGADEPVAKVRNVTRKPLGATRGRLEQVAIALRHDEANTVVELRSRVEKEKPLAGYEVVARNMDEKSTRPLGTSNEAGRIAVTPGKSAVQIVLVKSGDLTLAVMPIVPGAQERVEVWLPDDDMRLRAAAQLAALREDIVDVVARRTILMARVRQQIEEKNFAAAQELLESLGELPGPTQFGLTLDRAAQTLRSNDVQAQRRIDRLFTETRTALAKHLDPQPIGALYEELRQAEEAAKELPATGTEASSALRKAPDAKTL